jgi:signal transduction histidine kinase
MVETFLGSITLASITVWILMVIWRELLITKAFPPAIDKLIFMLRYGVGATPTMVIIGSVLSVFYFFLLSHQTVKYIEALNAAVHEITQGNLDAPVPLKRQDELGRLAANLALMASQLKVAMAEERRAERTKHDLITSVSHDLRTPLTSMLGYLELVDQDRYRDEVELRHYVGVAYDKSRQLKRMIDQLFEFTRTSHGSLRFKPVEINLAELLEQLAEEFLPAMQAAGMACRLVIPPERIIAMVDSDLLVRVFENLMSNAIRYGRAGKQVDLELEQQGEQISVRVANHGEPIPEWEVSHIFEKFYRVEKSRSERTGGAGLGLAIAKNIVELHEGSIFAYNEPGRTVFEVRIPARHELSVKRT